LTREKEFFILETRKTKMVSSVMSEVEKIILAWSEEKFFREGFYKTTMDEIAAELRMSKKTLYKFFPSKEELVGSVVKHFLNRMKEIIIPALKSNANAIEKLEELMKILAGASQKISPAMLDEMRRRFPKIWNEIDRFRTEMMFGNLTKVIDQGKAEGLFLNYPTPIIMNMLVASVRSVVNPEFILNNNFSFIEAALTAFKIMIGGILTDKGKEVFNKTISQK
jgi:AcrR family transcriptional regulator